MTPNHEFITGAGKIPGKFDEEIADFDEFDEFNDRKKDFPGYNYGVEQWANHRNSESDQEW